MTIDPLVPPVVQTAAVMLVKVTGLPEAPPVAVMVPMPFMVMVGIVAKVIAWSIRFEIAVKLAVNVTVADGIVKIHGFAISQPM